MSKKKVARGAKTPQINKGVIPTGCANCINSKTATPSWRFDLMGKPDIFPFPKDINKVNEILRTLAGYEAQTLGELRGNRNGNRYAVYDLSELHDKLDKSVVDLMREQYRDFEELHRFRIKAKERVYAICSDRGVFRLLFWDPKHEIYPLDNN